MLKGLARSCMYAVCLALVSVPMGAQEVVHALTGTVSSINNTAKTITVLQDNGSMGVFQGPNAKARFEFDKKIAAETTAANRFDQQGAYVIVFYFGDGDGRTAVALKNLGKGPFSSTEGVVERFDGHSHFITVRDNAGTVLTFKIDDGTVAEGNLGVVEGRKFAAEKGDHVRVVSSNDNGVLTALFLRDL